jgi:hypothetical protein
MYLPHGGDTVVSGNYCRKVFGDDDHDDNDHDDSVAKTTSSAGQEMGRTKL